MAAEREIDFIITRLPNADISELDREDHPAMVTRLLLYPGIGREKSETSTM